MVQWKNGCIANMRFSYALEVIFHWTIFFLERERFCNEVPILLSSELCFICSLHFFPKMQHARNINYNTMPIHSWYIIHTHITLKDSDRFFSESLTYLLAFVPNFTNFLSITLWLHDFKKSNNKIQYQAWQDVALRFWPLDSKFRFIFKLASTSPRFGKMFFFSPGKDDDSLQQKSWQQQKTGTFSRSF